MDEAPAPATPASVFRTALFFTQLTAAAALIALLAVVVVRPSNPVAVASEKAAASASPPAPSIVPEPSVSPEQAMSAAVVEALNLRGRWAASVEECARIPLSVEVVRDNEGGRLIWNANAAAAEQIYRLDDNDGVVTRVGGWEYRYLRVGDRLQVKDPTDPEVTVLVSCP